MLRMNRVGGCLGGIIAQSLMSPVVALLPLSHVRLFATSWTAAHQASLSLTISWSLLRSTESVMLSNHLVLCHPLLLLPSIFPSIRVFPKELALFIRWPKDRSFSINPSMNIQD